MKRISAEGSLVFYKREEVAERYPSSVQVGEDITIEPGMVVEHEGSKGVVLEIQYFQTVFSFEVRVYWFSGEMAQGDGLALDHSSEEFLGFLGIELENPGDA